MIIDSIARDPEAAKDDAARARACIETLLALVERRAGPVEIALASMAALQLVVPLSTVELTAEVLADFGDRIRREERQKGFREGWDARGRSAEEEAARVPLQLVSAL